MKKKGFTLVELIGVIILLGVLSLIAFPVVNNSIKNAKENAYKTQINEIVEAAKKWGVEHSDELPEMNTNGAISIDIPTLIQSGYLKRTEDGTLKDPRDENASITGCVVITYSDEYKQYEYKYDEECSVPYKDNSGANQPLLLDKMIPVKYENNNWVYANTTQEWYDYDKKEWANAIVLKSGITKTVGQTIAEDDIALWYVWIPRYKYIIFNGNNGSVPEQEIEVTFESGVSKTGTVTCSTSTNGNDSPSSSEICTNITNGASTYTHPAFTFGDKELTGIWVGKFENSGTIDNITIKPNVSSLRNQTVSSFFTAIQNVKTTYGISNGDSHMMKNMEWGSVAYLKQSKYGLGITDIGINNNSNYTTGCGATAGSASSTTCNTYNTTNGMLASTTGNIYGIYDMSGGAYDYVMGNMVNSSNTFYSSNAGFTSAPNSKYYDSYTYSISITNHERGKLGDATKETLVAFGSTSGGWNNDYPYFVYSSSPWLIRGGQCNVSSNAGIFSLINGTGSSNSTYGSRSVLVSE